MARCSCTVTWCNPTATPTTLSHIIWATVYLEGLTSIKVITPNRCFGVLLIDRKKPPTAVVYPSLHAKGKRGNLPFYSQAGWPLSPQANRRWTHKLPKHRIPQCVWERLSRQHFPCYTPFICQLYGCCCCLGMGKYWGSETLLKLKNKSSIGRSVKLKKKILSALI